MKIALIRHGMTEGNYKRRYIGKTDEPLTDTATLDLKYPDCGFVISSPMKRCIETAEFIYPKREITVCDDLRECDFGDFENKSYEDLKDNADYIKWLESNGTLPFPNGEPHEDFKARCIEGFLKSLAPGVKRAAFIIHGGTIMAIMQSLFGGGFYDYQIRCGGMFLFDFDAENQTARGGFTREE